MWKNWSNKKKRKKTFSPQSNFCFCFSYFLFFLACLLHNSRKASTWLEVWKSFKFILDSSLQTFQTNFSLKCFWEKNVNLLTFFVALFQEEGKKVLIFMVFYSRTLYFAFLFWFVVFFEYAKGKFVNKCTVIDIDM